MADISRGFCILSEFRELLSELLWILSSLSLDSCLWIKKHFKTVNLIVKYKFELKSMTSFIKAKFNKSDDPTNIDKYRLAANITENIISIHN